MLLVIHTVVIKPVREARTYNSVNSSQIECRMSCTNCRLDWELGISACSPTEKRVLITVINN